MSGIVGSYFNTRGSGVVAKLGADGQVFTSTGAGLSQGFEAAAGGGKILQVQSYSTANHDSQAGTSSMVDIASFLVTITPATISSKILIMVSLGMICIDGAGASLLVERDISGGATTLLGGTADSNRLSSSFRTARLDPYGNHNYGAAWNHLDSPSTTSAITYQLQWACTGTVYINRSVGDSDEAVLGDRHLSGMMAIEVGA